MAKKKTVRKGNAMVTKLNKDGHKGRTAVMRRKEGRHDWTVVGSSTVQEIWVGYCAWTMARTKDQNTVLEATCPNVCVSVYMCE